LHYIEKNIGAVIPSNHATILGSQPPKLAVAVGSSGCSQRVLRAAVARSTTDGASLKRNVATTSSSSDGGAESGEGVRVNNLALVTHVTKSKETAEAKDKRPPKELLHFGLDFDALGIGFVEKKFSRVIALCDSIFSFPHNDTNATELRNFVWADTDEEIDIHYSFSGDGDEVAMVFHGKDKIMVIQKVTAESKMRKNIGYAYDYRISKYGTFYDLVRLGEIDPHDFWDIFLRDIEEGNVRYSLGRIDICTDLSNVSPQEIINGIKGDKSHMKKISKHNETLGGDDAETIYYGHRGMPWFARAYNKFLDLMKKGKQRHFVEYIAKQREVTRLELQIDGELLKANDFHPRDCLNVERLFSLYGKLLDNKYVGWDIFRFIKREMKRRGFSFRPPEHHAITYGVLSKDKWFKRAERTVKKCAEAWGLTVEQICHRIANRSDNADY